MYVLIEYNNKVLVPKFWDQLWILNKLVKVSHMYMYWISSWPILKFCKTCYKYVFYYNVLVFIKVNEKDVTLILSFEL